MKADTLKAIERASRQIGYARGEVNSSMLERRRELSARFPELETQEEQQIALLRERDDAYTRTWKILHHLWNAKGGIGQPLEGWMPIAEDGMSGRRIRAEGYPDLLLKTEGLPVPDTEGTGNYGIEYGLELSRSRITFTPLEEPILQGMANGLNLVFSEASLLDRSRRHLPDPRYDITDGVDTVLRQTAAFLENVDTLKGVAEAAGAGVSL